MKGHDSNAFWRYNISSNSWETLANTPEKVKEGGALTCLFSSRTIYVDDDFDDSTPGWGIDHFNNIDDAMDASLDYDTIYVHNGNYSYVGSNYLNVNKAVNIMGESRDGVMIDGAGNHPIMVFNDHASVKNFNFTVKSGSPPTYAIEVHSSNVVIEYCNFNNLNNGVLIDTDASGTIVRYNNFWDMDTNAIKLTGTNDNYIYSNNIRDCGKYGIYLFSNTYDNSIYGNNINDTEFAIFLESSVYSNSIYDNTLTNSICGIELSDSITGNTIRNNIIRQCNRGIYIYDGVAANAIIYNTLQDNAQYGIHIEVINSESNNNVLHHNNLINNGISNAYDECHNTWDDGVSEGNYWDDYTPPGTYTVPPGINVDNHPLTNPV